MSIRLALAPWWVSWAAVAILTAVIFGPMWLLLETDTTIGRPIFITAAAFGQRRKMLRAALKSLEGAVEALEASGIDPTRRAETLTQEEFRKLATAWRAAR